MGDLDSPTHDRMPSNAQEALAFHGRKGAPAHTVVPPGEPALRGGLGPQARNGFEHVNLDRGDSVHDPTTGGNGKDSDRIGIMNRDVTSFWPQGIIKMDFSNPLVL